MHEAALQGCMDYHKQQGGTITIEKCIVNRNLQSRSSEFGLQIHLLNLLGVAVALLRSRLSNISEI